MRILIFLLFISSSLFAQEINIPSDLKFNNDADYKKTEQLVIDSTNWLVNTPLSQDQAKRREINTFLMQWMTGSPTVTIELVSGIVPIDCAECLMAFMSGYTKHSLENNYSNNKVDCSVAGAESTIVFYEKNKAELGRNSDMEKLIKQQKKGKLRKYVAAQF